MAKLLHSAVCVVIFSFAFGAKLPSSFKTCKISDPNRNECLRVNGGNALNSLKDGIPSLGILPAEPLRVEYMAIGKKSDSPIQLEIKHKDLDIFGITDSTFTKFESSFDDVVILNAELFTPLLKLIGNYEADGRLLVLPLTGNGTANITAVDLRTEVSLTLEKFEKKGKIYSRMTDLKILFGECKRVYFHLTNLFNGNQELGDQINNFMNENWDLVFQELKTGYDEALTLIFKEIANKLFTKVPLNEIFPPE